MLGWPVRIDSDVYDERPWATIGLIAANALAFLAILGSPEEDILPLVLSTEHFRPWQLLTSCFLHAGPVHLAGNMFFLYVFGSYVEARLGWWRYLAVYGACGVAGSLVWLVSELGADTPLYLLGASGAISGIMGFTLIAAPKADVRLLWIRPQQDGQLPAIPVWFMLGGWFAWQLLLLLVAGSVLGIGFLAHLGGFAAGIGLALLFHSCRCEGTPWHLERARGGGSMEEARRERTAEKWKAIGEGRRAHQAEEEEMIRRTLREEQETDPIEMPARATAPSSAPDAPDAENPYAHPPRGSDDAPPDPKPGSGKFRIDED